MKRTRPSEIKELLNSRDIHPSRVLGQNFLIDQNILNIILDSAHVADADRVLEIGPGLGVLTEHLIRLCPHVVAIEKDPRLAEYLRETFEQYPNLSLLEGDALELNLPELIRAHAITHVVSNLPYSSGTRMLVEMVDADPRPLRFVVMLQLDVAERIVAKPGTKAYGLLSIHAQLHYDVVIRKQVSHSCFYPPPDVKSAIIELYRLETPRVNLTDEMYFRELIKWCFSQRRKQLGTILQHAPARITGGTPIADALTDLELAASLRPEQLDVTDWGRLSNRLSSGCPGNLQQNRG